MRDDHASAHHASAEAARRVRDATTVGATPGRVELLLDAATPIPPTAPRPIDARTVRIPAQRLDDLADRLRRGLSERSSNGRERLAGAAARLSPSLLTRAAAEAVTAATAAAEAITATAETIAAATEIARRRKSIIPAAKRIEAFFAETVALVAAAPASPIVTHISERTLPHCPSSNVPVARTVSRTGHRRAELVDRSALLLRLIAHKELLCERFYRDSGASRASQGRAIAADACAMGPSWA
jgi:hypothetical protein